MFTKLNCMYCLPSTLTNVNSTYFLPRTFTNVHKRSQSWPPCKVCPQQSQNDKSMHSCLRSIHKCSQSWIARIACPVIYSTLMSTLTPRTHSSLLRITESLLKNACKYWYPLGQIMKWRGRGGDGVRLVFRYVPPGTGVRLLNGIAHWCNDSVSCI